METPPSVKEVSEERQAARHLKEQRVQFEDIRDMNSSEVASELGREELIASKRAIKRNQKLLQQQERQLQQSKRQLKATDPNAYKQLRANFQKK